MKMDQYVVIGNPIAHSKSPQIHAMFAQQTGQSMGYEKCLAPLDGFAATVHSFMAAGGRGANVTVPFKLEAYALANSLSARAAAAGAVNTFKFHAGQVYGDNTDGSGLVRDIQTHAGFKIAGSRVLLLGAGGAAQGSVLPLLDALPAQLIIANRSLDRAEALVQHMAVHTAAAHKLQAMAFSQGMGSFDLIINATSASLNAQALPISPEVFGAGSLAYDMMYAAQPSAFLEAAAQAGAHTRDGLGMLVEQAAEAFYVWRDVRPDTLPVYQALRQQLCASV